MCMNTVIPALMLLFLPGGWSTPTPLVKSYPSQPEQLLSVTWCDWQEKKVTSSFTSQFTMVQIDSLRYVRDQMSSIVVV